MTTSDVTVVIGINDVSNYVKDVDITKNKATGIGSCELILKNDGDIWGDTFLPNDDVNVSINGALMFVGFVDNVTPTLAKKGVIINEITVKSRDHGRYLTDYYNTAKYEYQESGAIIDKILAAVGDPLLYTDPTGTPSLKYECQRTYLSDALIEIGQLVGYDFYIDTNGRLQYFAAGTVDSTVDLLSVAGSPTNNLLSFEESESIGADIKNIVEVHAGSVKDHWTEGGASDWTTLIGAGSTITDSDPATEPVVSGATSIKFVAADDEEVVGLNFTTGAAPYYLYSQGGVIDMTDFCQASVAFIPKSGSTGDYDFNPTFIDTSNNIIYFTRNQEGQSSKGYTQEIDASNFTWRVLSFPIGKHIGNEVKANPTSGFWHGDVAFDWATVAKIGFRLVSSNHAIMDTIFIDALYIPNVEAKAITRNVASTGAYGTRMVSEYHKELHSQIELNNESAKRLRFYKDPVQKFKAVAIGQTDTKYAAQTVDVQAPSYGIAALTDYIIVSLHHKLHYGDDVRGWDFVTEYELVYSDIDATRVIYTNNPTELWLQELRKQNRGFKGAQMDDEAYMGDWMTGFTPQIKTGAAFPTDMNDGDLFFLTDDYNDGVNQYYGPAEYKYDEATGVWIRDPMVMHRNANPPAGGEMLGDTLHRTDLDKWYRWTGAWTQINFAATTISGTLSSSQLKKGIQPFDSAVFFYPIRVAAPIDGDVDIDVNNGAGKAVITASALTPFSSFLAGDELIIQGCEDSDNDSIVKVVDSVGGGGASITLTTTLGGTDNADDGTCIVSVRDGVRWVGANPAVWFGDGTSRQVVSDRNDGLAFGSHWIYFSTADTDAHTTATYANAVGDTVGIICRLEITNDAEPLIMPVYSRGGSITLDFLGAGAVDTIVLTSDAIIGKDFRTAANVGVGGGPAGIKFDKNGIYGYSGGVTQSFYLLSSTGKAYCAAGKVILDGLGITLNDTSIGFYINGDANRYGYISAILTGADEDVWITTENGAKLILNAATIVETLTDILPVADKGAAIGDGTKNFVIRLPIYNGADPGAPVDGEIWVRI